MPVELEVAGGIGILYLRRPESANALDAGMLNQISRVQRQLRRDKSVRVVITIGEGKGFCAGSDLREQAGFTPSQAEKSQLLEAKVCREFLRLPQPTIACVHGYALGGGLFLATHHDFQVVSADARLGLPEVKLGWNPTFGIHRLCQLVGVGTASRWMMQGSEFTASEAAEEGCITQVVSSGEDVLKASKKLAEKLLELPLGGLTAIKQAIWGASGSLMIRCDAREARLFRKCLAFSEAQASTRGFAKKH
ncbi:MAG TPA: enoyl-CoA hydratase/isomerase family protein [Terriglobales bacterium]|jgi:enoyl-CoA hydratase|nr:enoyl-CoA hydratase/isomerase family protein [Terriglobales bacterium]